MAKNGRSKNYNVGSKKNLKLVQTLTFIKLMGWNHSRNLTMDEVVETLSSERMLHQKLKNKNFRLQQEKLNTRSAHNYG